MEVMGIRKKKEDEFDPYEDNSGTTLTLKQKDYIIVASDTRHSSDMGINSRSMSKVFTINDMVMSTTGFYGDGYEVFTRFRYQIKMYEARNLKSIDIHRAAHLLHNILYSRRFFPYYSFTTLTGFGDEPTIYDYDPIGCYESVSCSCNGSSSPLIQPILDSLISKKNWENCKVGDLSENEAIKVVRMAFESAAERDVKTGDYLEVFMLKRGQTERTLFELRKD